VLRETNKNEIATSLESETSDTDGNNTIVCYELERESGTSKPEPVATTSISED
jgi:hypothetical protein